MSFWNLRGRKEKSKEALLKDMLKGVFGFAPKNLHLFVQACTHKSNNNISKIQSNERLEYLGDTILSTLVGEYLYYKYPKEDEGFLTKMRAKIVKRSTLNKIARQWRVDEMMTIFNDTLISDSMLGNTLEALVGALYIEKGFEITRRILTEKMLLDALDLDELEDSNENYKSILLEWCQKENKKLDYPLLEKVREKNKDKFKIGVRINNEIHSFASGYSKKSAEQLASKLCLEKLGLL